ncbi:MAG: hypothetical protein EOP20_04830 [Hyphomicrobiales bacterium]|nr:MAG: hypothetical protein EOP20_04830 [Hyphomicrobiales bacterium]
MKSLPVQIIANGVVIGTAQLSAADPSMAVASAIFEPRAAYRLDLHSRASEQRDLATTPAELSARTEDGKVIACAGIDLIDFAETVGDDGREVWVLGIEQFETYFG